MKRVLLNWLGILLKIESAVDRINQKWEGLMAKAQDFKALVDEINVETDRVAAKIDELTDKLEAGGMTEAEEAQALTDLRAVSDRLKTIGKDPADPIPPEPTPTPA